MLKSLDHFVKSLMVTKMVAGVSKPYGRTLDTLDEKFPNQGDAKSCHINYSYFDYFYA